MTGIIPFIRLMEARTPEAIADRLLVDNDSDQLRSLERQRIDEDAPLDDQVAVKLARSKTLLAARPGSLHVSVVFAMYREQERILTPENHPLGEDFVNTKVAQLRWLFGDDDRWDWCGR